VHWQRRSPVVGAFDGGPRVGPEHLVDVLLRVRGSQSGLRGARTQPARWHRTPAPSPVPDTAPCCPPQGLGTQRSGSFGPFPCIVTSSRDLMRVLMNLCPSFPSIMLLRIWGTWRRGLRATEPGHMSVGTHPSTVALGTRGVQGRGVGSLGELIMVAPRGQWPSSHPHCGPTGAVPGPGDNVLPRAGWRGSASSFATADKRGPACTPKAAPGSAHLLLVLILQFSVQEVQSHRLAEIDDLQAEREHQGRAQGSRSRCRVQTHHISHN